MLERRTIWWDKENKCIRYIDQTGLPAEYVIINCKTVERLAGGIKRLEVRGAPALGCAGAFGIALAAIRSGAGNMDAFLKDVTVAAGIIKSTRPTAINLAWGVDRVLSAVGSCPDPETGRVTAVSEAERIAEEDTAVCRRIGDFGAELLPDGCRVLTHCNAGALACSSWGTALGVIRSAVQAGKNTKVFSCETRPLHQGGRLTTWELSRDGIDVTAITDSTAAFLMRKGEIDCVLVGADRITEDAVFNKIGTYMHAVCARHHGVPMYVAAPISTFDSVNCEADVVIEERGRDEIALCGNRQLLPDDVPVRNPAFDATPMELVTAIITEKGVIRPPFSIRELMAGER